MMSCVLTAGDSTGKVAFFSGNTKEPFWPQPRIAEQKINTMLSKAPAFILFIPDIMDDGWL
ncbi:MAG: hypothetical protein OXE99_11270 [Cellvibrionales bacterium]|nr:hypothetical protein [Cellvibrionales bacterium]